MKEFQVEDFIRQNLRNSGHSHTKIQRTPLGEKIIIHASRPGIIVGRKGQNIKKLTMMLKKRFNLENPQIEIAEVENVNLDAQVVAERIASSIERFGIARFKGVAHRALQDVMGAGALGVEVFISGKVPSQRARTWRFYEGYLKKCGDIALVGVDRAYATAKLKSGVVGIKVKIMPPTTKLPDDIEVVDELIENAAVEEKPEKTKTAKRLPKRAQKSGEPKESDKEAGEKTQQETPSAASEASAKKETSSAKKASSSRRSSSRKKQSEEGREGNAEPPAPLQADAHERADGENEAAHNPAHNP